MQIARVGQSMVAVAPLFQLSRIPVGIGIRGCGGRTFDPNGALRCRRHVLGRHYFCSVPRPFEGVSAGHTDYVFLFLQFVIGSLDVAFDTPE